MRSVKKGYTAKTWLLIATAIITVTLFLGACSSSGTSSENEITLDLAFGTKTGVYDGEMNEDGLPDGFGTFTTENSEGMKYTYEGEWKDGHLNGQGKMTWENGQCYEGMYENDYRNGEGTMIYAEGNCYEGSFVNDELSGQGKMTYSTGIVYEGEFASDGPKGYGIITFEDGSYMEGVFEDIENGVGVYYSTDGIEYFVTLEDGEGVLALAKDSSADDENAEPDITLEDNENVQTLTDDFFADDERNEFYTTCYKSYQYKELYDYVENYIEEEATSENDSAYSIIEILEPIVDYDACNWTVSIDEFDGKYVITYDGATQISNNNSIEIIDTEGSSRIRIGFRKSGWLFFDEYALSINGEQIARSTTKYSDPTRNVISGNTIEEFCFGDFNGDPWSEVRPEDTVILRFTNSDTKENYDHTLTDSEKNAIYCYSLVHQTRKDLVALQREYR